MFGYSAVITNCQLIAAGLELRPEERPRLRTDRDPKDSSGKVSIPTYVIFFFNVNLFTSQHKRLVKINITKIYVGLLGASRFSVLHLFFHLYSRAPIRSLSPPPSVTLFLKLIFLLFLFFFLAPLSTLCLFLHILFVQIHTVFSLPHSHT